MTLYDGVADDYDAHFDRPVDRWEDDRLAALLGPYVRGRRVLDLGCGTGWLADHLDPALYVGVDASSAMLLRLMEKHPEGVGVKAEVNRPGWTTTLPRFTRPEVVTATWAAHDFGDLGGLLKDLKPLLPSRARILLHGQAPRYAHRHHYVLDGDDTDRGYRRFTPAACRMAAADAGLEWCGARGTGAAPDWLHSRLGWRAMLGLPPRWHYAFLAHWRTP